MHLAQLAQRIGTSIETVRYHLPRLRGQGVATVRIGRRVYVYWGTAPPRAEEIVLREEPHLRELHAWLRRYPGQRQLSILDAMEGRGWPRATTQHRLKRLVDAGLALRHVRDGATTYHAEDPHADGC